MTATVEGAQPAPLWFWAVSALSLFWNAYGGYDYVMSHLGGGLAYFQANGLSAAQIAAVTAMPKWMTAIWAIGVWGSVAGSLALLARRNWAFPLFVTSLSALAANTLIENLAPAYRLLAAPLAMSAVLILVCAALAAFSRAMARRGVLG